MTNAHVVVNSERIHVYKPSSPHPFVAKVSAVSSECDLATLTVDGAGFWEDLVPLVPGTRVPCNKRVQVMGYSKRGNEATAHAISAKVGPLESHSYAHSCSVLLTQMLECALTTGLSGGPAIADNEVVGVAFQNRLTGSDPSGTEGQGQLIPLPILQHFLEDARRTNDQVDGFPSLGITAQSTRNPALRAFLGLQTEEREGATTGGEEGTGGIMITSVAPLSCAQTLLHVEDVILRIAGFPVCCDGTVHDASLGGTIPITALISRMYAHEEIEIEVWRKHKLQTVVCSLRSIPPLVPGSHTPSYLMWCGFIFQTLSMAYIDWLKTTGQWDAAAQDLYEQVLHRQATRHDEEVVLLTGVLADYASTNGYHHLRNERVVMANGLPVFSLRHLHELLGSFKGEHFVLQLTGQRLIVVQRDDADRLKHETLVCLPPQL